MVPPDTITRPVNELLPERLQMPVPVFVSVPEPVMLPVKATLLPLPTVRETLI